jgi:hypothetical protein
MKNLIVILISGSILALTGCRQETTPVTSLFSKEEDIKSKKWRIVISVHAQDSGVKRERRWLISPEGQTYIVPKSYQEKIDTVVEGDQTGLPRTVLGWDKAYLDKKSVGLLQSGIIVDQGNSAHTNMWMESIYFFAY